MEKYVAGLFATELICVDLNEQSRNVILKGTLYELMVPCWTKIQFEINNSLIVIVKIMVLLDIKCIYRINTEITYLFNLV